MGAVTGAEPTGGVLTGTSQYGGKRRSRRTKGKKSTKRRGSRKSRKGGRKSRRKGRK